MTIEEIEENKAERLKVEKRPDNLGNEVDALS